MGQEKCTEEIKITHTFSVGIFERKRYFGKSSVT
jgi:hypothetical protein